MRATVAFVCLTTLFPLIAAAQTVPSGPLTLEQVLELAESRSEAVAIARTGIQRAEGDAIRAKAGLFPQLRVSASYDRALASEFEGVFDGVDLGGGSSTDDPATDDGGLENLPFGRENTWRLNLNLAQNIFDFGRIRAARSLAAATRDSAVIGLTTARAQALYEVTQAYYDAALADRLVVIAEASITQAGATLQQVEAAFNAGTQPEFEVLRARVTRDTQNPALIRARVNRELALLRLKQMLDLPADSELQLADALAGDAAAPPAVFASRVLPIESQMRSADPLQVTLRSNAPNVDRAVVREAATTVRLRELTFDSVRAERLPSISANSSYGRVAYPTNIAAPTFDRVNWTVGFTATVPILTGGRQRGDEAVAAADIEQSRVRLRQTEELAALDSRSAWAELVAARASWEATAGTVQQANRAYEIAEVRYQAGVSTQLELSDSRLLLQQAEANRAQASRDLQVARARLALLPDLPLGVGGTATWSATPQQQTPAQQAPVQTPGNTQLRNAAVQPGAQQFGGGQ